ALRRQQQRPSDAVRTAEAGERLAQIGEAVERRETIEGGHEPGEIHGERRHGLAVSQPDREGKEQDFIEENQTGAETAPPRRQEFCPPFRPPPPGRAREWGDRNQIGRTDMFTDEVIREIARVADELKVEPAALLAVAEVE